LQWFLFPKPFKVGIVDSADQQSSKKMLIFAYYFPPLGVSGVQRVTKLVKFLPRSGWNCSVITPNPLHYYAFDATLLNSIPPESKVIRTPSLCPQRLARILLEFKARFGGRPYSPPKFITPAKRGFLSLLKNFIIPDEKLGWLPFAVRAGLEEISTGHYKAIMTTSPPESIHLIGLILSKVTGIPWLADFRDEWATRAIRKDQPSPTKWANHRLEALVLSGADAVTTVSPKMTADFSARHPEKPRERFATITNGFDPEVLPWKPKENGSGKMVLTHVGNFVGLHSAKIFLQELSRMKEKDDKLGEKLTVRFLGMMRSEDVDLAESFGIGDVVEFCGYLPHRDALQALLESDALLLLISEEVERSRILLKTFEYLWARRPILAIGPMTEGMRLLQRLGIARIVSSSEGFRVQSELRHLIEDFRSGNLQSQVPHLELKPYSWPELTKRMAELLDAVIKS